MKGQLNVQRPKSTVSAVRRALRKCQNPHEKELLESLLRRAEYAY
jgi:preprotein translocase subunit Sss1